MSLDIYAGAVGGPSAQSGGIYSITSKKDAPPNWPPLKFQYLPELLYFFKDVGEVLGDRLLRHSACF